MKQNPRVWPNTAALDVFKYGAHLSDSRKSLPVWMDKLLHAKKLAATPENKAFPIPHSLFESNNDLPFPISGGVRFGVHFGVHGVTERIWGVGHCILHH